MLPEKLSQPINSSLSNIPNFSNFKTLCSQLPAKYHYLPKNPQTPTPKMTTTENNYTLNHGPVFADTIKVQKNEIKGKTKNIYY